MIKKLLSFFRLDTVKPYNLHRTREGLLVGITRICPSLFLLSGCGCAVGIIIHSDGSREESHWHLDGRSFLSKEFDLVSNEE